MDTLLPRRALLEFQKLARAFFALRPRNPVPPVELYPYQGKTLLLMRRGDAAIALRLDANAQGPAVSLPSAVLGAASRQGHVEFCHVDESVELRWTDQNVPQRMQHAITPTPEPPVVPELSPVEARLINALADASAIADSHNRRYALGCIQLDGASGTITGTDGRQLLQHQGFRFPWGPESLLIPGNRVFAAPELRREPAVACTREGKRLVLAAGPWRLWLPLETEARYPEVAAILPDIAQATNRVCFDPADLDFLKRNLRYLPGAEQNHGPVTVDLNGHVDVAADQPAEGGSPMRVRLNRSTHLGTDNRVLTDRAFLQRAAKLGLKELFAFAGGRPLLCRAGCVTYLWQPLYRDPGDQPADRSDEVLVESLPAVKRERSPASV